MSNEKVWTKVLEGYRLPRPVDCPLAIYNLMMECWGAVNQRPSFSQLVEMLEVIKADEMRLSEDQIGLASVAQRALANNGVEDWAVVEDDEQQESSIEGNLNLTDLTRTRSTTSTLVYLVPDVAVVPINQPRYSEPFTGSTEIVSNDGHEDWSQDGLKKGNHPTEELAPSHLIMDQAWAEDEEYA